MASWDFNVFPFKLLGGGAAVGLFAKTATTQEYGCVAQLWGCLQEHAPDKRELVGSCSSLQAAYTQHMVGGVEAHEVSSTTHTSPSFTYAGVK